MEYFFPHDGKIQSTSQKSFFGILPPLPHRRTPVKDRTRTLSARGVSVRDDWSAWLPDEKQKFFTRNTQELESNYTMWSISLDEALRLRREGQSGKSLLAIGVSSGLCRLLTEPLTALLRALSEHAKHYGTIPNAAPLDPENFHGQKGRHAARMSGLLNRVLFSQRFQFLHKVTTLGDMVEDLAKDFRDAAHDLAEGASANSGSKWDEVDSNHFDINTCLRETVVLFKSFMIVLPADQLPAFRKTVCDQAEAYKTEGLARQRLLRHRRMTAIAGQ